MTLQNDEHPFKVRVQRNVVLVRVVVRDSKGRPVPGLRKEDFRLFDNRKRQVITEFSMETSKPQPAATPQPSAAHSAPQGAKQQKAKPTFVFPQHYLALFFDDLNMPFEDIVYAREAVERYVKSNLEPTERVAIFTSGGAAPLDFTADRDKLAEALSKLRPKSRLNSMHDCPEITHFEADRIVNYDDDDAYQVVMDDAAARCHMLRLTKSEIRMDAQMALSQYEQQAINSLDALGRAIRRISTMPGQRTVIFVSSGFMPLGRQYVVGQLIDRALRSQVVVSAIDAKGLAVLVPEADASRGAVGGPASFGRILSFTLSGDQAATAVMAEMAEGTGGEFIHNSNDLYGGIEKLASPPEVWYTLAFSPEKLKFNGLLHKLKVELVNNRGFSIQARRGYFAPKSASDAERQAAGAIDAAAFSQTESMGLPVEVYAQFSKIGEANVALNVFVHLNVQGLPFRTAHGRHWDDVTFTTVLFDQDGRYLDGKKKEVQLHLSDALLAKFLREGMTVPAKFTVKPGNYFIREIVRESGEGESSTLNHLVELK